MSRTGPTNPVLQNIIAELKKRANVQRVSLWKRVALDLEKATRNRRLVNLSKLNRVTKEDDIVIVPGKVLGTGKLEHKITISAFQFSESAKDKLKKAGANIVSLLDVSKDSPKGKKIRIIG